MKYKQGMFLGVAITLLCLVTFGAIKFKTVPSKPLNLTVNSVKQNYMVGEPVELSFALTNQSNENISLGCFGLGTGDVQLFISEEKSDFLEYDAGWGNVDAECHNLLKPSDKLQILSVKILWNHKVETSHLNQDAAKVYVKGKILNDYAFSKAGTYFIKAIAFGNSTIKTESKPVKITIEEPDGENLEVWNKIKDNRHIAYFLQNGYFDIPSYKPEETEKLRQKVEQILIDHPNSFYFKSFKQSLEKFQAIEEKRKAYLEKIKQP